jgi:hypothetical protein
MIGAMAIPHSAKLHAGYAGFFFVNVTDSP